MYELDRAVAIIKPRQPFLDWVRGLPGTPLEGILTLEQLRRDCTALLIPQLDEEAEEMAFVYDLWEDLFEGELAAWSGDEGLWPESRTVETFIQWFDVEIHSTVVDVVDDDEDEDEDENEDEE